MPGLNFALVLYRNHLFYVLLRILCAIHFLNSALVLTEIICFMYLHNSFSDVCTILRRDSEQAIMSIPGAFVDGRWRMFRGFSATRRGDS